MVSVNSIQKSSLQCAQHYKPLEIAGAPLFRSERTASSQSLILATLGEHVIFPETLYSVLGFNVRKSCFLFWGSFLCALEQIKYAQNLKIIAYVIKKGWLMCRQ